MKRENRRSIFGYPVRTARSLGRGGVVEDKRVLSIEEKPDIDIQFAVPGFNFRQRVVQIAKHVRPSAPENRNYPPLTMRT